MSHRHKRHKDDLALALRPKKFDDMIGAERLVRKIRGHFKEGRVKRAWLFCGQKGAGKTTIARILALSVQCRHDKFGNPCRKCRRDRHSFDIIEQNMPKIGVKELRELLKSTWFSPMPGSRKRVYILDEFHSASPEAQTLMLKYTEDIPRTTLIILCSTRPDLINDALRSRCQVYTIPTFGLHEIRKLVRYGLKECHSDKSSLDLAEQLMEKGITSPRLILNAVQKYADTDATAEEAAEIEIGTEIDTLAICVNITKGNWGDVSRYLVDAKPEDMPFVKYSVAQYLKSMLLGESEFNSRSNVVSKAIIRLYEVRDDLAPVTAVLYRVCHYFSKYRS